MYRLTRILPDGTEIPYPPCRNAFAVQTLIAKALGADGAAYGQARRFASNLLRQPEGEPVEYLPTGISFKVTQDRTPAALGCST